MSIKGDKVKIGIIGLGTVGSAVVEGLTAFSDIEIVQVAVKELYADRQQHLVSLSSSAQNLIKNVSIFTDKAQEVALNPDVDVLVEVAGGVFVLSAVESALKSGKSVVTANKELLALHGNYLHQLATQNGVQLLYEAAVGGGIPLIGALKQLKRTNTFIKVEAILNGTTNFILDEMSANGTSYAIALAAAQAVGYAETDPTKDVEGYDTLYKLAVLSRLLFNQEIDLNKALRQGITKITSQEVVKASQEGLCYKLIGTLEKTQTGFQVEVAPRLVSKYSDFGQIHGVENIVKVTAHPVGVVTLCGLGAGGAPTATAVLGDLLLLKQILLTH